MKYDPAMRGRIRVANVYRCGAVGWHPSRHDAEQTSRHVERHTGHRLAYRVVARFK